ncbi:hypothetical protein JAAARDRAFT_488310 [Jaapia argillacea MUCL 33604]|uniref:Uncharacterized protein n=1 Tax=Jaapia argillacea MUCL 33604 TaxID=933084 RepID=A0A067PM66_9AGAM|nr:hypothetical protein JAAARDRAFT_488310 [Jaapia argillacea MUCL 33604]
MNFASRQPMHPRPNFHPVSHLHLIIHNTQVLPAHHAPCSIPPISRILASRLVLTRRSDMTVPETPNSKAISSCNSHLASFHERGSGTRRKSRGIGSVAQTIDPEVERVRGVGYVSRVESPHKTPLLFSSYPSGISPPCNRTFNQRKLELPISASPSLSRHNCGTSLTSSLASISKSSPIPPRQSERKHVCASLLTRRCDVPLLRLPTTKGYRDGGLVSMEVHTT